MLFGNRGPRSSGKRQRKSEAYRPRAEALEDKALCRSSCWVQARRSISRAADDCPQRPPDPGRAASVHRRLFGHRTQTQGNQTTDPGLGILETGNVQAQGVGYNVAALGDMNLRRQQRLPRRGPDRHADRIGHQPGDGKHGSQAFLVFGNRSATVPTIQSWLSATPEQRVGVINNLGRAPA